MSTLRDHEVTPVTTAARLATGDLIEATEEARRVGFRHRLLIDREVWEGCVRWDEQIEKGKVGYSAEEQQARLRNLVWMARVAARVARGPNAFFDLHRVPTTGRTTQAFPVTLRMTIGPGDEGHPVIVVTYASAG